MSEQLFKGSRRNERARVKREQYYEASMRRKGAIYSSEQ